MIPQEIIDEYNLSTIIKDNEWCYAKIYKAMYWLKEAGYFANVELKQILAKEGYNSSQFTPGLFMHKTRDIVFSLVVDDFGVKYTNKEDIKHLAKLVEAQYPIKCNWHSDFYFGTTME